MILFKIIKRIRCDLYRFYLKHISRRVDDDMVVFLSQPDYSDNARALSEYMVSHDYSRKYRVFFCVTDAQYCRQKFPDSGITFVQQRDKYGYLTSDCMNALYHAKYVMSTHGGALKRPDAKPDQSIIWLWHGCSFKDKTEKDSRSKNAFDTALVAGDLFVKTKAYFWNVPESKILAKGYPRYDWLLSKTPKAINVTERLRSSSERLVIWMPTFRNDAKGMYNETNNITQFPLIADSNDWRRLDKQCRDENITIVVKLHPKQKQYPIPFDEFTNIQEITNSDLDGYGISLYEFIACTDALITDYSSIAIDYLVVDKPIAFTLDDFELYKDGRGFVFKDPREYMPGHHMYKLDDLFGFLHDLSKGNDPFDMKRKEVSKVAVYQSNHYCQEILNALGIKL